MSKFIRNLIEYEGIDSSINDACPLELTESFKQSNIDLNFCVPDCKPDIEQIVKVWVKVVPIHHQMVKTPVGVSYEGQIITGYKLLFVGDIHMKMEYVADDCEQSVHSAHTIVPFCEYVVMPKGYNAISAVKPNIYVEDIYTNQANKRCAYSNITLMTMVRSLGRLD